MRQQDYLDGLMQLHRLEPEEQRSAWRQSMATLAAAVSDHRRSVPLEGVDPRVLAMSLQAAIANRLLDDLEWLSPPAAAAAIFELASALPAGDAKRELGRMVLQRLRRGDAATFVALATQLALGSRRALSGVAIRARVALCLDLPIGSGARADGLALALISRRDVSREWLIHPSTGSLPSRRLAARLLERAAREAAQRWAEGDDSGVRVFETEIVQSAFQRLLADRESLVWRHVASARGLLCEARPEFQEEIDRHLDPGLTITEWRRAAASLAASIGLDPRTNLKRCRELIGGPLHDADRGIPTALVLGLPRAAEREPEAVEELLEQLVRLGGLDVAEALVDLRRERIGDGFAEWAAAQARAQLRESLGTIKSKDEGQTALAEVIIDDLDPQREATVRDLVAGALESFVEQGARDAALDAQAVLEAAERCVAVLEESTPGASFDQDKLAFRALREIDLALFESDALANLLALGARGDELGEEIRPLGDLFQRVSNWLVIHEGEPLSAGGAVPHFTRRMRRLRTLLHLVDADGRRVDDRPDLLRQRRQLVAQVLLQRVEQDAVTPLRRAVCASAARACDALVREEMCEVSDIVLAAGRATQRHEDLTTMAEAAMVPDLEIAMRAFANLYRVVAERPRGGRGVRVAFDALMQLANDLPVASSPRVEALRRCLLDLARALEPLGLAGSLTELSEISSGESPLAALEVAVQTLAKLGLGTRRRLGQQIFAERPSSGPAVRYLDIHLDRAFRGQEPDLLDPLESVAETLREELPRAVAEVVVLALRRLGGLPLDGPRMSRPSFLPSAPREAPLPAWMPPSRTLGGFYVTRAIGTGAVGSVFVARRAEARHDPRAELFALKVPEYSGGAARTLSEEEFFQLFRSEAGALLALPQHENIARFVTFDAGARPKPILVMELVQGPSLERVLELGTIDMPRALDLLEGIAEGLGAMHALGIAHLDVKPSNIILRESTDPNMKNADAPVLVDFGLAGRHIRPGCGTANYGAPEVWGHDESQSGRAVPADVYAFGCLAYEVLTGETLFDENQNDIATITAHLQHDGLPSPVGKLTTDPRTQGVAELVRRSIRRNPDERVTMRELRGALQRLRPGLSRLEWPIRM